MVLSKIIKNFIKWNILWFKNKKYEENQEKIIEYYNQKANTLVTTIFVSIGITQTFFYFWPMLNVLAALYSGKIFE